MSGFFNETNYGRIVKMCEMLEGPMAKSATSNKATPEQWTEMLDPLMQQIEALTGGARAQPEQESEEKTAPIRGPATSKYRPGSPQEILEGMTPQQMLDLAYVALLKIDEDMYDSSLKKSHP
ncbi:MAG: hypothetical protein AAF641_06100 [Pseudomonadota bacterium]